MVGGAGLCAHFVRCPLASRGNVALVCFVVAQERLPNGRALRFARVKVLTASRNRQLALECFIVAHIAPEALTRAVDAAAHERVRTVVVESSAVVTFGTTLVVHGVAAPTTVRGRHTRVTRGELVAVVLAQARTKKTAEHNDGNEAHNEL